MLDEGFMEQILGMTLRHNPMIRLDISQVHPKEGDRGKPLALDVPMQEAVVNQRLHSSSEVMWKLFLQIRSSSGALSFASRKQKQLIPPKGFVSQLTESSISGVRSLTCHRPASFNFAGVWSHEWVTPTMPKVRWPSGIPSKLGTRKAQA